MVGRQQHLQSLLSQAAKRHEFCHSASSSVLNYSKASMVPGEGPCLSSRLNSFSPSVSKSLQQFLWKSEFSSPRTLFSDLSDAIAPVLSSSNGSNETQKVASRPSKVQSILHGIKQDSSRGLFIRNPSCTFIRENHVIFGKIGNFCSLSKSSEEFRCWNCRAEADKKMPFLFCQACRSVQPVNGSIDYFQIFGLGRTYKIELEGLEKKYKDWQKKLHPDLVHSKSQREREYAAEQSARVIDAYRTLTDPLLRAIYMVKLEGVAVDEEERIANPKLLAEIMELREAVEEAGGPQALKDIQAQLHEKLQHCSNSFEDAFLSKNYEDAVASIQRMTYYKRANEEIIKKL